MLPKQFDAHMEPLYIQSAINAYGGAHGKSDESIYSGPVFKHYDTPVQWTQAHVLNRGEKAAIISIRGTDEWRDWMSNFFGFLWNPFVRLSNASQLQKNPYRNMGNSRIKMHIGGVRSYVRHAREKMHAFVRRSRTDKIIIVGHSRGSLLAQIASTDLQYHHPDKDYICRGYGMGEAGNRDYVLSRYRRIPNSIMYCHGRDIVYDICPYWAGYWQSETPLMLGNEGTGNVFEDHRPKYYQREIQKLCV